ncbi:hypothetical protein X737_05950 [Mesorhizobium sp. L48C026A00]|nr:hypothetical protein X737_05950 [Mesorhizobium sp. L48C026A00]
MMAPVLHAGTCVLPPFGVRIGLWINAVCCIRFL